MLHHKIERLGGQLIRTAGYGAATGRSTLPSDLGTELEEAAAWWQSFLRNTVRHDSVAPLPAFRIVDAFCGPGGLALGVAEAARSLGFDAQFSAIIDTDAKALEIHRRNLGGELKLAESVASLVDFHVAGAGEDARFAYFPEVLHRDLRQIGKVDLFIAGPPCEGHSNLNNHTRRADPRNQLYVAAVALAIGLDSESILIENVPTVRNDKSGVVNQATRLMESAGYVVESLVLRADDLGAAQRRVRFFLLGRRASSDNGFMAQAAQLLAAPATAISHSIGDLIDLPATTLMDSPPVATPVNAARIDYLFDHDLYDLPDQERPDCHKAGTTYRAVYGRMHWDRPSHTITTGFGTPGQGRYVHPLRRRLITPREAARIQGFPDWFDFVPAECDVRRKDLHKWIGDAVHPILGYAVGLAAVASVIASSEAKRGSRMAA